MSVKTSELVSYNLSLTYRYDMKKSRYGYNSNNLYATLGTNRSLTPYSSMNVNIGVQQKIIHREKIWTPTVRLGYNRKVVEGFSINLYGSLDNENVDTYRGSLGSYLSIPACAWGSAVPTHGRRICLSCSAVPTIPAVYAGRARHAEP